MNNWLNFEVKNCFDLLHNLRSGRRHVFLTFSFGRHKNEGLETLNWLVKVMFIRLDQDAERADWRPLIVNEFAMLSS